MENKNSQNQGMPKIYSQELNFENQYELQRAFLQIFAMMINIEKGSSFIRPKLLDILTFYMMMGYSKPTKNFILENYHIYNQGKTINYNNLKTINSELQEKGLLTKDQFIDAKRDLSPSLIQMKEYIESFGNEENKANPYFLIKFNKI